ncbi:MAG: TetR/AcrR family transcriptional regulator [Chitinophagales bacterium]
MTSSTLTRKQQILIIATRLFEKRGYNATSMRDLAKEVGIEPASLYSHFRSKEEILKTVCNRIADEFFEEQEKVLKNENNPVEKLRGAIVAHISVIANNMGSASVFFKEWKYFTEVNYTAFMAKRSSYESIFRNIIHQGIEQDYFEAVDVNFIIKLLFSMMNDLSDWYNKEGELSPIAVAENIHLLIYNGIKKKN